MNIPMPPSTREESMASNSNVWCNHDNSYDPPNFLHGNPTKTSLPLSNATIIDLPVDDDTQHPQPINTAPDPAILQEWNDDSSNSAMNTVLWLALRPMMQAPSVPAASMTTMTQQWLHVAQHHFVQSSESSRKSIYSFLSYLTNSKNKPPACIH